MHFLRRQAPRLKRRHVSSAVEPEATGLLETLRIPSAGRNVRHALALKVVVYKSGRTASQRRVGSTAARDRNTRSYTATALNSKFRDAFRIVSW